MIIPMFALLRRKRALHLFAGLLTLLVLSCSGWLFFTKILPVGTVEIVTVGTVEAEEADYIKWWISMFLTQLWIMR